MKPFGGNSHTGSSFGQGSNFRLSYITPPPALDQIPSSILVPFKNLQKKDSTTKAKALEDIVAYVRNHSKDDQGIPESVLVAWVDLYARVSIDNSRRVRELSHIILLDLLVATGKRMEKKIAKLMGAWLAGAFDKDKAVAKAANEGLQLIAPTEEKRRSIWNKAQSHIMGYALEAIDETSETLSDERSTKKEDADAKYYRVVASSLSLVTHLIQLTDIDKLEDKFGEYVAKKTVWQMALCEDSFVRKSLYGFLRACLDANPNLLKPQLGQIGQSLIRHALRGNQSASATELCRALTSLTKIFPEIWGEKKSPFELVLPLVEKGSQGSSREYWVELRNLLIALPGQHPSPELASKFLKAMRKGISNREEPKANKSYAWSCYLSIFEELVKGFIPDVAFLQTNIFPMTQQFLIPAVALAEWEFISAPQVLPKSWALLASHPEAGVRAAVQDEWDRLVGLFVSQLETSLPEVSKDHQKSQQATAAAGDRWFTLVAAILENTRMQGRPTGVASNGNLGETVTSASLRIVGAARDVLTRRDYKPFAAASIIQSASTKCPALLADGKLVASVFNTEDRTALLALVASSSLVYLVSCLEQLAATQPGRFESIWTELVAVALESKNAGAIELLVSIPSAKGPARRQKALQDYLASIMADCARGENSSWALFETTVTSGILDQATLQHLARLITTALVQIPDAKPALQAINILAKKSGPRLLSQDDDLQMQLITNLLAVTELQTVSDDLSSVRELLEAQSSSSGATVLQAVIQKNLDDASPSSLKIDTLLREVSQLRSSAIPMENILPNFGIWLRELTNFLQESVPDPSLSLHSRLGGAYFLVENERSNITAPPKRDAEGRSIPARMALYVSKLFFSGINSSELPLDVRVEYLHLLSVTAEVAEDQWTMDKDGLWTNMSDEVAKGEAEQVIRATRHIFDGIVISLTDSDWREADLDGDSLAPRLITHMLGRIQSFSSVSFYTAKSLCHFLELLVDTRGPPVNYEAWFQKLALMKTTPRTTYAAIAFLLGFGRVLAQSPSVERLCRELISTISGSKPGLQSTLCLMVLLNACMDVYEPGTLPVPNRNQLLAFQQMGSWMDTPDDMSPALSAEVCKAIFHMLPNIQSAYGHYWEQLISHCLVLWNEKAIQDPRNESLPYLYASIKLMLALESATDPSEDLVEALAECSVLKPVGLLELLKLPRDGEVLKLPPHQIVDELLGRAVEKIPFEHIKDFSEDLYPLLASTSRPIQTAAFGLVQQIITASQEEIAMDLLLEKEKREVNLPQGLLDLVLEVPPLDSYPVDVLLQFPTAVRSYLLAWHLIFDAYSKAPHKLQDEYTACIKRHGILEPFLDFMFAVLGHSAATPLNLEQKRLTAEYIRHYDITTAEDDEEKNLDWLLVNLCYLTLTYLPGLFRTWYIDCSSKQTKVAVEAWIKKYFSSMLVQEALNEVAKWDAEQEEPADDEKRLQIRISYAAREVVAEYEIDDEFASIVIRVPAGYPLETVEVQSQKRVAVDEKKWKGWMIATQGIITFANGTITDGLAAFRRNIVGALKGQTECAICYSIVATDKKLPDKRCGTCKNLFHGICLYKWVQNSGRNSCPLCRNPINFLGDKPKRSATAYE
ncbi:hypothetical protein V8F33_006644 [Rhypophila sp. PSN 637]